MTNNLLPFIQKIEHVLQKLGLSFLWKINILKMVIVLKINYLSYMLTLSLLCDALLKYNQAIYIFNGLVKRHINWGHRGRRPWSPPYRLVPLRFLSEMVIKTIYDSWISSSVGFYRDTQAWIMNHGCLGPVVVINAVASDLTDFTYSHPVQAVITQTNGVIPYNNPVLTFSHIQTTSHSTQHFLESPAKHPPCVKKIGQMVLEIYNIYIYCIMTNIHTNKFLALQLDFLEICRYLTVNF